MTTRLEGAYNTIATADKWSSEGNMWRAFTCYEGAIRDFMHLAFVEETTVEGVTRWLSDHPIDYIAHRYMILNEEVLKLPKADWTHFFDAGPYLSLAFSHLFALLGQHDRALFMADVAIIPELDARPFWTEYAKTYWALLEGKEYQAKLGKLSRTESYWSVYIDLMQAAMRGEGIEAALAEVDRQFAKRNRDTRHIDDAYMLDGTGDFPVKFDFRKAGLLASMAHFGGVPGRVP